MTEPRETLEVSGRSCASTGPRTRKGRRASRPAATGSDRPSPWSWRDHLIRELLILRRSLVPPGTLRARAERLALRGLATWRREGMSGLVYRTARKVLRLATGRSPRHDMQDDTEYRDWIERNDPDDLELEGQRRQAADLTYRPLISILTPVFNTPVPILDATIRSVLGQTYDHWELCLADGHSTDPRVREALRAWEGRDPRIRVEFLAENRGISGNSNAALATARGEFVALLDHDDLLAPPALFENASLLNRHPEADFIYSDRDLISEDGTRRFLPFLKPEWSPEVMLTANYLTHLCVFRTRLARQVGGFDPATDGAQDWDLFLRVTERSRGILHIPKVLYHWRYWSRSTATGVEAKPYAQEGQRRTLEAHYQREGISGGVECLPTGFARIRPRVESSCRVSIIVAADHETGLWPGCVGRLLARTRYDDLEVIVIEGHAGGPRRPRSSRGEASLARDPRVRVLAVPGASESPEHLNRAAGRATGDALLFFSERLVVDSPEWLSEMAHLLERPAIGAVGPKLLQIDGTLHHAGLVVGLDGLIGHPYEGAPDGYAGILGHTDWYRNYLAVSGDCLLLPRDLFDAIGGFDDRYQGLGADVDLCLRVWEYGRRVVYTPYAKLWHLGPAAATGDRRTPESDRLRARCGPILAAGDPFFHPHASRSKAVPTLAVSAPAMTGVAGDHGLNLRASDRKVC